jgi:hypothetical protein
MNFKQISIQGALLLFSFHAVCQHMVPVSSSDKYHIDYKRHAGELILNNGKNIKGVFQYRREKNIVQPLNSMKEAIQFLNNSNI